MSESGNNPVTPMRTPGKATALSCRSGGYAGPIHAITAAPGGCLSDGPCQITTIELSPLLEIACVVLNSTSKQALVQLAGAGPSPADRPLVFEIARLQLSEGGNAGMIQLNLLGQSPPKTLRD